MWPILILYSVLALTKGEMRLCSTPVSSFCKASDYQDDFIPGNAQELLQICPSVLDHLECLHSYDIACRGRSQFTGISPPLYYNRIKSILDDACDETSSLYRVLGRSLPCIRLRASSSEFICHTTTDKVLTAYENYLTGGSIKKLKNSQDKKYCLSLMATVACMMQDIENECGFLAYETARDLTLRSQIFPHKCGLDIFLELKDVIEDLRLESNMKDKLRKYFVVEID